MHEFTVSTSSRLDAFLTAATSPLSRSQVQRLILDGRVKVNGVVVHKPALRLHEGDRVAVSSFDFAQDDIEVFEPVDLRLPVLYEDDACLVIDKPAGIAVHPAPTTKGEPTILHGIAQMFQKRGLPFSAGTALVHRLDRETTGCLLVAKTPEAHSALQKQFKDRTTVRKTYLALVAGVPDPPSAVIEAPVGRKLTDRTKMSVLKTSVSRDAKTTYRTRQAFDDCALLECDLHTGRTHQIRVHLSSIGHPILGDPTYASQKSEKISQHHDVRNLCLHAWELSFVSPADGEKHEIVAGIPDVLAAVLQLLGVNRIT